MISTSRMYVEVLGNGEYRLTQPMVYEFDEATITIYTGFTWDGASIPRGVWSVVGCPSDYLIESCLHDALYMSALYSQKISDKLFHKVLVHREVDFVTAKAMYLAVRAAGASSYGTDSKVEGRKYVLVELK